MHLISNPNAYVVQAAAGSRVSYRLFCFPFAGGGASFYRRWVERAPGGVAVCPIQLPGRETRFREPPFHRLEPLVQALAEALTEYLDTPFAFFGHSMGALIAFETARTLRRQTGLEPQHLFVSALRPPQLPSNRPPIHQLSDDEFLREVVTRYHGIPDAVKENRELLELYLPTLRADFAVCETYTYQEDAPLSCPILALGGWQDKTVSRDDLLLWRTLTRSTFALQMFAGGHFYLQDHLGAVLSIVLEALGYRADRVAPG